MKLALDRSPSFLESLAKEGEHSDIIIARDLESTKVVGIGYRTEAYYIFQGNRLRLGYLGGLRLLKKYRSGLTLAKGYRKLKELHEKSNCKGYFTTIQLENKTAMEILESHRAGLPFYQFICQLKTYIWNPKAYSKKGKLTTERVTDINLYRSFFSENERPTFLKPEFSESFYGNKDITRYFIKNGEQILACFSIWNQTHSKRWRVSDYSGFWRIFRNPYNLFARFRSLPKLPLPGSNLEYCFLTQFTILNSESKFLSDIVSEIFFTSQKQFPGFYLCCAFSKEDPWNSFLKKIPSWTIESNAYFVCWEPSENIFAKKIDGFSIWEAGFL